MHGRTVRTDGRRAIRSMISAGLAGSTLFIGAPVLAQEEPAAEGLQEIVVTATRRAESAQSVPVAITALRGEQLQQLNIGDNFGVAKLAPSLAVESAYGLSQPRWRMRGVGSNAIGANAQAAVGVYSDDVLMSAGNMQSFGIFDMERVEVLRGPQGTLWGRNITGGAIHFVSKRPTEETSGYAQAQFGANDERNFEGAIGGALVGDSVLGRVSFSSRRRDGQYENLFKRSDTGGYDRSDVRVQLLGRINEDTDLYLKIYSGDADFQVPFRHTGLLANGTNFQGFSLPAGRDDVVSLNSRDDGRVTRSGATLQLNTTLAGGRTLTGIVSYDTAKSFNYFDDDATPLVDYSELNNDDTDQKIAEVRLASSADQRIRWIGGLYYLDSEVTGSLSAPFQSNVNFPTEGAAFETTTSTKSSAIFGTISADLTDRFGVRLGARYSRDEVSASGRAWSYAVNPLDVYDRSSPTLTYLDLARGIFINSATGLPVAAQPTSRSWNKLTGDVTLEFKPRDEMLLFLRAARGYRAGNANTYIYNGTDFGLYNPEQLDDIEVGLKTTMLDGRVRLNAAAFRYDIKDMQVTVVLSPGSRTQNAAKARVSGAEIELETQLTERFYASLSLGYQDSEYTDFRTGSAPFPINLGAPLDLSGESFERAPEQTVTGVLAYTQPLSSGSLVFSTDWRYTSRFKFQPWVDSDRLSPAPFLQVPGVLDRVRDTFSQDAMTIGNASVSYRTQDERLEVGVWGKNLTNEFYPTSTYGFFFNRSLGSYLGELRSYGISLTYRFGDK
jgi:iron complex outermembrane recepter protein